MIDRFAGFVDRLRQVGVPVSTSEAIDASTALAYVDWADRSSFKETLATTMVKNSAHRSVFDTLFDIYFAPTPASSTMTEAPDIVLDDMTKDILDALMRMDLEAIDALAAEAIRRYAGMEPGRPVGGRYYRWKVEQALGIEDLTETLTGMLGGGDGEGPGSAGGGPSGSAGAPGMMRLIASDDASQRIRRLIERIDAIIRARLIADRGPDAMARALVRPLPEDVEFLQASSDELADMRRTVALLARRLAARLAYKHHRTNAGRLDFRRTIRSSLQTGGVPIAPRFKHRTHKPEIVVLCDVSGSVAAFSRFALALLYSLSRYFTKVRSFAFVDGIDEVTGFFEMSDLDEAIRKVRTEAKVVWLDGHSDYGHSLSEFAERYQDALGPRTTVLLLGDVRSNFRGPELGALKQIKQKARRLYLLNPEPYRHWDSGDSIVSVYEPICDGVFECRNLKQLAQFIERIA
ncbi:MAG: VWA domain-containing protein [Actinomycetota bacterium]|nr:VWA domain-containing protein [Actinomycetota bacterium]